MVTFLSGGTGTPKLLWGAGKVFPREETTVIANTGDDIELGGLHVSPDVDTVIFERSGLLDRDTWWGIEGDSTVTDDTLRELATELDLQMESSYLPGGQQTGGRALSHWRRFGNVPAFMTIGDRDRAHHMLRTHLLEAGRTLTEATRELGTAYDLTVEILPMSDAPVATIIDTDMGPMHFQEYWVRHNGAPSVREVEFRGGAEADTTGVVETALEAPVIIGPANPITSLGPMLAIDRIERGLRRTSVVAVSPFIEDRVFSGPANDLMSGVGREASTAGVAEMLPMVDAFVLDEADATRLDRPVVRTDTRIETKADATRVASACEEALEVID